MEYLIHESTLTSIADGVRKVLGVSSALTPVAMASSFQTMDRIVYNELATTGGSLYGGAEEDYPDIAIDHVICRYPPCDAVYDSLSGMLPYQARCKTIELPSCSILAYNAFDSTSAVEIIAPMVTSFSESSPFCNVGYTLKRVSLDRLSSISAELFRCCSSLVSAYIPSAAYIGESAFESCYSLPNVSFPLATYVGYAAFSCCSSLQTAYLPEASVIGNEAFVYCFELRSIVLNTAVNISSYAFSGVLDPTNKILNIYMYGSSVGSCDSNVIGDGALGGSGSVSGSEYGTDPETPGIPGLSIYVPASLLTEFKTNWCSGLLSDNIFAHPETE